MIATVPDYTVTETGFVAGPRIEAISHSDVCKDADKWHMDRVRAEAIEIGLQFPLEVCWNTGSLDVRPAGQRFYRSMAGWRDYPR